MRRPRGHKTRKAVAKRFKITASGKVMRSRAGRRHLLSSKSPTQRRRLGQRTQVSKGEVKMIKTCLPFSH